MKTSLSLLLASVVTAPSRLSMEPSAEQNSSDAFQKHIQPLFAEHCYECHGPEKQKGGLRLDRRDAALAGGDSGPAIVPGKGLESRLFKYVAGLDPELVMPPKGERLSTNQIVSLRAWIDAGAPWPETSGDGNLPAKTPATTHWAFMPPQRPHLPAVKNQSWVRTPIDAFVAARHEQLSLTPVRPATAHVLIRRLYLDLTGLPPDPSEIDAFVNDTSPNAYERLVERLLSSPHYGERWGRHWLDLARWAESDGYEANELRSAAWRYRDYVVKSFNSDKPYDQFLREQIAGDELTPYTDENIIATGFLAAGRLNNNEEDKAIQRNEALVDVVNATASVTLGVTLNCAQCHDHKFDPFTARDYYRFQGFFVKGHLSSVLLKDPALWKAYEASIPVDLEPARALQKALVDPVRSRLSKEARQNLKPDELQALATPAEKRTPEQRELARKAEKALEISKDKIEKALSEDDKKLLREVEKKVSTIEKQLQERKPQTWAFYSPATSPHQAEVLAPRGMYPLPFNPKQLKEARPRLLKRGDAHRAGAEVEAGWPAIFGPVPGEIGRKPTRLVLANWLSSSTNPLVARVWVNFLWQQHFGRGLVATSGDFGTQGAKPSHPELLDWLATELMSNGWSTKHIHRLIVLSSTYRAASDSNAANAKIDPENQNWWRWSIRRLEAEAIRDCALAASGELDQTVGGQSVRSDAAEKSVRRSLYLIQKRHELPNVPSLFDGPTANESCPRRHVSTIALQSLYLTNSEFGRARARRFAERVRAEAGENVDRQIDSAFRIAIGRVPSAGDREDAQTFFARSSTNGTTVSKAPVSSETLIEFCQALLNVNEFVYLE